jgi:SAM-dependent methyltransferase
VSDILARSWSAVTEGGSAYNESLSGKQLLADVLKLLANGRRVSLLDLGCGSAALYDYLRRSGLDCDYTGVEFSERLFEAAQTTLAGEAGARVIRDDVATLSAVHGRFDIAVYSHVIEMLGSPEAALLAARDRARKIVIRFFEPPDHETDLVEVRELDTGDGKSVPYLRRSIGRDQYRLILGKLGCASVDVYRDEQSREQTHVLHFV